MNHVGSRIATVGYHRWFGEYHFQPYVLFDDVAVFEKSLSNILPGEMGVVLGLEDQRY